MIIRKNIPPRRSLINENDSCSPSSSVFTIYHKITYWQTISRAGAASSFWRPFINVRTLRYPMIPILASSRQVSKVGAGSVKVSNRKTAPAASRIVRIYCITSDDEHLYLSAIYSCSVFALAQQSIESKAKSIHRVIIFS